MCDFADFYLLIYLWQRMCDFADFYSLIYLWHFHVQTERKHS